MIFSLISTGCAFYAMVYPAWFYQHYRRDGKDVFQGYGIFAFYSTAPLESPFYASETVLQYHDFWCVHALVLGRDRQSSLMVCPSVD